MKQKKIMIIAVALIIIIAIIAVIVAVSSPEEESEEYVEVLEDGTKVNTSEKLSETKTYNGLEFTNIKFTNSSSVTNLSASVTNTTTENMDSQLIGINVLDESGNVITSFTGTVEALEAGETTTINAGIAANYANAYNIEIVDPES